jgi:hypothetical protein
MILIYIFLLLLIVLLVWDAIKGFRIVFTAHASTTEMIARVGFRNPILSFEIQRSVPSPILIIRLFDIRLMRKNMAAKRKPGGAKKGLQLARSANISGLTISADYGLGDPFYTSMALAAVGATAKFLPFEQLDIVPDYLSVSPYLSIRGNVTVKFGKTILKYVQNKS